jgi:hypothetical protein
MMILYKKGAVMSIVLPPGITDKYETYNYNNAIEILHEVFPEEYGELMNAFINLDLRVKDVRVGGGNESSIPKKINNLLRPLEWQEVKITGDLLVKIIRRHSTSESKHSTSEIDFKIKNYINGHNIDYVKGKVAFDMEWNSKDQTFDRDLYAFRTFFECGIIEVGIILTRSESLNEMFRELNILKKYGSSTTWMGKLLPRLDGRRHGGCPILAMGITPKTFTDWSK